MPRDGVMRTPVISTIFSGGRTRGRSSIRAHCSQAGAIHWPRSLPRWRSSPRASSTLRACPTARIELAQALQVDDEAITHVAFLHAIVGAIDLLHRNCFDVCAHPVLGAEVEHLLGLAQP